MLNKTCLVIVFRLILGIVTGIGCFLLGLTIFQAVQRSLSMLENGGFLTVVGGVIIFGGSWLLWFIFGYLVYKFCD